MPRIDNKTRNVAADNIRRWREHPDQFVRDVFKVTPDPWQDAILKIFPHQQRIAMQAPLAFDNIVPTPKGMRRWGDIQPGDMIFAEDGTPAKVLNRFDAGKKETFRVTFRDGSWVDACRDHIWKVQTAYDRKINKTREMTTGQMLDAGLKLNPYGGRDKGQRKFNVPTQGAAQFKARVQPLDPYVFGLWIGDGSRAEPAIICPDPAIRKQIEAQGFSTSLKANGKTVRVLQNQKAFEATGILDLYCYEKYIPDKYKFASVEQRLALLRGMMDADGTVALNNHCYYASSSEKLIEDFIWLARSLGYLANKLGPYVINDGVNRDSYRVVISGERCPFLAETMKKKRWRKPPAFRYARYIDSIESVGIKECMCIEVNHPSSCFLANDFIISHNCKGPGKTCLLAWLAWNFLLTRPYPKVAATSITGDNLADNLWTEMAFWQQKSELLRRTFTWQKTRIFANDHPETWWMSARQWSKSASPTEQGNTLAGLHADYIMFLLDESGGMPDAIMAAADAALSSCKEGHIVQAGNPTNLEGPLYRACTAERKMWHVVEITGDPDDPNRSPRVKVEWAKEQIERYGRDNPWVLVNVFGRFPPSSFNALIGPDEVNAAMKRYYRPQEYSDAALILGVDVAREGDDSSSVITRQGIQMFAPDIYRNVDGTYGANVVAKKWLEMTADACFVDNTGGFGSSWIDNLNRLGFAPIPIHFNEKSSNPRYFNKRTEMAFDFIEWIKKGGALPVSPRMLEALTKTTYTFKGDKLIIEPKELIKARLGYSPDEFDSGMLTFAAPVVKGTNSQNVSRGSSKHSSNYNPLDRGYISTGTPSQSNHQVEYNPFGRN